MSAEQRDVPDRQVGGGAGFPRLADELMALFARGVDAPLDESTFNALALRAFTHQMDSNATYRAFCEARGVRPAGIDRWEDVPAVPATAFKRLELVSSDGRPVEAVFHTSGTTGGYGARGRHLVPSMALYRASLLPNFRAALLPGGERLPLLSLVPSPAEAPDSSLSAMVGTAGHELCDGVRWLVDGEGRLDLAGFVESAAALEVEGRPALLAGTAYAFVHVLDGLTLRGEKAPLPAGTRIMETGGFKGRSRVLGRDALYRAVEELLGVPAHRVVNEYGMTELLSQLYEPVLREGPSAERRHVPPPWLRARALDPGTLEPLPPGEVGLLAFFDLANLGSVCHVLTEDLGSVAPDGVRLQGRVEGAEPRGCSRAMEELMTASGRRS